MTPGQMRVDGEGRTVILIHFAYHTGRNFVFDGVLQAEVVIACIPDEQNLSGLQRTGEPGPVNCPDCKKSEKWKMAARANGMAVQ